MSEGNKGGKIESVREPEGAAEPKVEMPEEPVSEEEKQKASKAKKPPGRGDLRLAMDVKEPPAAALEAGKKARGEAAADGGQEGGGGDLATLVREVVQLLREIKENQQNQQGGPFLG